jgi:hypothetical protein
MPKSRAPRPPQEPEFKRIVFCTGKVGAPAKGLGRGGAAAGGLGVRVRRMVQAEGRAARGRPVLLLLSLQERA